MKISLDSQQDILIHNLKELSEKSEKAFSEFLKLDNYEEILEKTLDSLSDMEKEVHLKTIEDLEKKGHSKDDITLINLYVLNKKEFPDMEMNLNEEEQKVIDTYEITFKNYYKAIQEKREYNLSYKPLQADMIITDTLLKVQDVVNKKPPTEHKIKIEV